MIEHAQSSNTTVHSAAVADENIVRSREQTVFIRCLSDGVAQTVRLPVTLPWHAGTVRAAHDMGTVVSPAKVQQEIISIRPFVKLADGDLLTLRHHGQIVRCHTCVESERDA